MQANIKFSSKRLLLTLTLCACSVILLQNYDISSKLSFPISLLCLFLGLAVCFVCFVPSLLLKKRFDADVLSLVRQRSIAEQWAVAVFYAVYFLFASLYFLLPYTDMFCKKYYPETSPCMVALLLLACCVYAAVKGANAITRFGIFLFALAMLTNTLLFSGSISSLRFDGGMSLHMDAAAFLQNTGYFITPCFIAVLYACLAGSTRQFRLRHTVIAVALTGVKFALVLFFIAFAVGEYSQRQEYQTYLLSRVAHFGAFGGIESFYMALCTMSVFMILSLMLCCLCRAAGKDGSVPFIASAAGVVMAAHLLLENNNSLKEIFTNSTVFNVFSIFAAAVVPGVYLLRNRRRYA